MTIAATLIMKNEEEKIKRCIESLIPYVDEILIADTGSTDSSITIAKELNCKVFNYNWDNNFSNARNFILSKSNCNYNLVIDADEYITKWDKNELNKLLESNPFLGKFKIYNLMLGNNNATEIYTDYVTRLLPNNVRFEGIIHEYPVSSLERKLIPIEITHDGYFDKNLLKTKRNIPLLLESIKKDPKDYYLTQMLATEYYRTKEYSKAKHYFNIAYTNSSFNDFYYKKMVFRYLEYAKEAKDFEIGMQLIEINEQYFDKDAEFYFITGNFFLELIFNNSEYMNMLNLIEDCFKECIKLGDSSTNAKGVGSYLAYYNLGVFYETTGNLTLAKYNYQKAKNLNYDLAIKRLKKMEL